MRYPAPHGKAVNLVSLLLTVGCLSTNPIISDQPDLADPSVLEFNNTLYLYPTSNQVSYEVYTFSLAGGAHPALKNASAWVHGPTIFTPQTECLVGKIPGLGKGKLVWAPHVIRNHGDGKFYLYYSVCLHVGVAVAEHPLGPFVDHGKLVENAIDAFVLQDQGSLYLLYSKIDYWRIYNGEESIVGVRLSTPTTIDRTQGATQLIHPDQHWWEFNRSAFYVPAGINEAPWVHVENGSSYLLIYSGAGANTAAYRLGCNAHQTPSSCTSLDMIVEMATPSFHA